MTCVRIVLLAGLAGLMPTVCAAQGGAETSSFSGLRGLIEPGQQVVVTDVGGGKTRGDVVEISDGAIILRVRDSFGGQNTRTFEQPTVAAIRRSDRLWNGILIGLAAGVAAAEIWNYNVCGPRGSNDECTIIATGVGLLSFIPGGAVAGALIDKGIGNHLVYSRDRRVRLQVSPVFTPTRHGVAATIRF